MRAIEIQSEAPPSFEPPVDSGTRTTANLSPAECVRRMLGMAAAAAPDVEPTALVQRLLEMVAGLVPGAVAGVRLAPATSHTSVVLRSQRLPQHGAPAAGSGRLFPQRTSERQVPVGELGTLHLAADSLEDSDELAGALEQAAGIVALTWRSLHRERERITVEARAREIERLAAVGQAAAAVVHQLGGPLTVIAGSVEMLGATLPDGDAALRERLHVERIAEAAARMRTFMAELLRFAEPVHTAPEPVELQRIVARALELCASDLDAVGARTELVLGDVTEVIGRPAELVLVFLVLFTNAAHAMHGRGGRLRVRAERAPAWLSVEVEDEGHGIAPENLERIFEPYFTTKSAEQGTGLGLAMARRLVASHGGRIYARPTSQEGAVFCVELPVDTSTAAGDDPA